ncbi:type VI secretion protein [Edwardsiella piscicida]|uniref:type VI secretion protein n=2 Tax=Edwardsiella piscicida TaxID=1263550 RepID=UPI001CF3ABC2|nr:type VI secretion protein [Edwardsiella piscicida]UCQ13701.1 type VI secretion protein [Edwardsiella piscicida]UCQ36915.1 type VI secretion protein [Edwardsiella piscicida]UCQ40201.1 type VI secretion protein [Edwardsiella piscicida]WLJ42595.1 type VI secretion protein [Edwardsiella piscicida]WLJ45694.1 type VI secretion protein [Edwardsiella piscicida]
MMNIDDLTDEELWEQLGPKPKRQAGFYSAPVLPTDILRMADVVISHTLKFDAESFDALLKKLKACQDDAMNQKATSLLRPPQWPIDSHPDDAGGHGISVPQVIGHIGTLTSSANQTAALYGYIQRASGPLPTDAQGIATFSTSTASNVLGAANLINTADNILGNPLPKPAKTALTAINKMAEGVSPYIALTNQIIAATQGSVSVGGNALLSTVGHAVGGGVGAALSVAATPVGVILGLAVTTASVASTMDVYGTLWDLRQRLYPCTCGQCDERLKFIIERYDQSNTAKAVGFAAGFIIVGLIPAMAIGMRKLHHRLQGSASYKHQMCLQMIQAARSRGTQMKGTPGPAPLNGKPCMPGFQVTTPGCPTAIAAIALLMGDHGTKNGYLKTLAVMLSTDGVDNLKKKIP